MLTPIKRLFYCVCRKYLMSRYPNLQMGYGTVVFGKFHLRGSGSIVFGDEACSRM